MSSKRSRLLAVVVVGIFLAFTSEVALSQTSPTPTEQTAGERPKEKEKETANSPATKNESGNFHVVFDEANPGVVYIEVNGEKIRVDTAAKKFELVAATNPRTDTNIPLGENVAMADPKAEPAKPKDDNKYDFDKDEEPWDYRIVNVPTPKHIPKGTWNMVFTHRFSQQLRPLGTSARALFGLDSFGIASFGVSYGVTDKFFLSAYRSPLCRRGICRTIEIGAGYNWIAQSKESPIALTTYASVEGNDNFTEEYTYNLQAQLSARVNKRLYLFFSPAVHINSNGQHRFNPRPNDFFPAAPIANTFQVPVHGASFGFGATVMITPHVSALFDFVPRTGFKMGTIRAILGPTFNVVGFRNESHPSLGFGIQRTIGQHSFALTFSNTQATTTSRYNSSNLTLSPKSLIIGFNLSRRF